MQSEVVPSLNAETQTHITNKIAGLLLLSKADSRMAHALAVFGLFKIDFPEPLEQVSLTWDALGVCVTSPRFKGLCTCDADPKAPRINMVPNDPERHASTCDVWKLYTLGSHANLINVEDDGKALVWDFAWPRTKPNRNALEASFGELKAQTLWENFEKGWNTLMTMLPPQGPSMKERLEASEPPTVMDFDDMDLDLSQTPVKVAELNPKPEFPDPFTGANPEPSIEEVATKTKKVREGKAKAEKKKETDPTEPTPPEPSESAAEPETTNEDTTITVVFSNIPGIEEGTVLKKNAREKKRAGESDSTEAPKKTIPACLKFRDLLKEECAGLLRSADDIADCESFPADMIKLLKNRLDRLAIKAAHLAYRGGHDNEDPGAINIIIETTLANVQGATNAAIRDLGMAPQLPKSWEDFQKELKDQMDVAKAAVIIMSQMGIGIAIQEPPKLKDAEGKALV
jgi:hypothetical protein